MQFHITLDGGIINRWRILVITGAESYKQHCRLQEVGLPHVSPFIAPFWSHEAEAGWPSES